MDIKCRDETEDKVKARDITGPLAQVVSIQPIMAKKILEDREEQRIDEAQGKFVKRWKKQFHCMEELKVMSREGTITNVDGGPLPSPIKAIKEKELFDDSDDFMGPLGIKF